MKRIRRSSYFSLTSSPGNAVPETISATVLSSCCGPVTLSSAALVPLRYTYRSVSFCAISPMGKVTTAKLRLALTEAMRPSTPWAGVMVKTLLVSGAFGFESETPIGAKRACVLSLLQKQPVKLQTKSNELHKMVVRITGVKSGSVATSTNISRCRLTSRAVFPRVRCA